MTQRKSYGAYRESGIKWLGRIPENWSIYRVKSTIEFSQNGVWGEDPDGGSDDIECARVADFDRVSFTVSDNLATYRKVPEAQRRSREVKDGDLLFEKSGGGEKTLVGAIVQYKGSKAIICSNFVSVIKVKSGVNSRWLCYANAFLYSIGVNSRSIKQATGIQNIDSEQYFSERIPVPSKLEQDRIAIWLDRETARIDTLIAKKTRFIDLLKEKRQAVITKAVTKGLDDSVEMKESGLKWLGNVPRHWSVMACKYGCSLIKDGTHLPPPRVERGIPLLSVRNVQDGKFDFRPDDSMISESDYHELCRSFKPKANDVLLAIVGATIGKTAVVPENMGLFHLQRSLAVFRVKKKLNHLFLNFIFQSAGYQQLLWENIGFSAQPGVYLGALSSFRIPVPPLDEQLKIVEYVIDKTQRTDMLIAKTERSVELLKEHRAALITAAVTGKIDVREAA